MTFTVNPPAKQHSAPTRPKRDRTVCFHDADSVAQVMDKFTQAGSHYFSRETVRFFRSKIIMFRSLRDGQGILLMTSERMPGLVYHVAEISLYGPDGGVDQVSRCKFITRSDARAEFARQLAASPEKERE